MGHRAFFAFKNRRVEFSAPDAVVLSRLSALIDLPFIESGAEHGAVDCSIALAEDAGRFAVRSAQTCKLYDTLSGAVAALTQTIPFWLLPFGEGYVLHGGAIVAGGKAHVFLGPGHVGKSTLALEAWLMGYEVLGDDRLLLDPQTVTIEAIPKPMKLRPGGGAVPERLSRILKEDDYCLGYGDDAWTLILSRALPRMTPLHRSLPIASLHLLTRSGAKETTCEPADKHAFFRAAFDQTVTAPKNGLDILRCFLPMLGDGRVFALHIGQGVAPAAVETMITAASCA